MPPLPPIQQNHQSRIPTTLRRHKKDNGSSANNSGGHPRRRLTLDLGLCFATEPEAMFSSVSANSAMTNSSTAISCSSSSSSSSSSYSSSSPLSTTRTITTTIAAAAAAATTTTTTNSSFSTSSSFSSNGGQQLHQTAFPSLPPLPASPAHVPSSPAPYSRVHSLSRSQTPTNNSCHSHHHSPMNGSMTTVCSGAGCTGSATTLPRERPLASPKCFGKNTHILKEDYERERLRWEKKLEEAEQRLSEAAANNAELFQLKAELNRKIIDFEKSQKPLVEQNRRLNDRLKAATTESRKLEQKMAFVQDELLSLRDQYDRVLKENGSLREQRAFPEKLEELGRYRAQVLEMSKCITALRQSAAEKDRRHELLLLKLKRMRLRAAGQQESDRQSCAAGSDGSVEDSGSLGLDTIAEDLDEDVELSAELLIVAGGRGTAAAENVLLRQQLDAANEQLVELQQEMDAARIEASNRLTESNVQFRNELDAARKCERLLQQQLANEQAQNELLEFQLVELTEGQQQIHVKISKNVDKNCSTDISVPIFPVDDGHLFEGEEEEETARGEGGGGGGGGNSNYWEKDPRLAIGGELRRRRALSPRRLDSLREGMHRAIDYGLLGRAERGAVRHGLAALECLQQHLNFAETELNMSKCENVRLQRELEQKEQEMHRQRDEVQNERQQRKRELKAELELLRKERAEESASYGQQVEDLSSALSEKIHALGDLKEKVAQIGAELDICRCQLVASQAESTSLRAQISETANELERLTSEFGVTKCELEAAIQAKQSEADKRCQELQRAREESEAKLRAEKEAERRQSEQLRVLNRELEAQFNTQMDLIGALKRKLLAQQSEPGRPPWAAAAATRSCGSQSTEDEQYHSEGCSSEEGIAATTGGARRVGGGGGAREGGRSATGGGGGGAQKVLLAPRK